MVDGGYARISLYTQTIVVVFEWISSLFLINDKLIMIIINYSCKILYKLNKIEEYYDIWISFSLLDCVPS